MSALVFSLKRNAARVKQPDRICPKPLVVVVKVDGHSCCALLDSGSFSDFISTTVADQLKLKLIILDKPLPLQLAVSGSQGKVKQQATARLQYQAVDEQRVFDIINVDSYDLILGTPFLFQHQVLLGMNPSQVNVRSDISLPIWGTQTLVLESRVTEIESNHIEDLWEELRAYAKDICKEAIDTLLPPLHVINHVILQNDKHKVYSWRPSKCPEPLKALWRQKWEDYLKCGCWQFCSGCNAVPMLMLYKLSKDGIVRLQMVCDTREQNKNSRRLASPLPDIEGILHNVTRHKYHTLLDGRDAYEQIRIAPEDVEKSLFTTPDGTMVSLVMQIGDCNASVTYQLLMNHIFSAYIGVFMDVYLDDIVIYSDTVEDHVRHVKLVIDKLRENHFFLSSHKLQFFKDEPSILGHVIDADGICMDPTKVDQVLNWKMLTNKSLVNSFTGSVGYLVPGCKGIRVPMHLLSKVGATTSLWCWTPTEQRAFDLVKQSVHDWRELRCKSIDYTSGAPKINLAADSCLSGGGATLSQGDSLATADIVAFWSGKFNSAQQNYPVHEQELLAIVESLKRFRHLLQGVLFRIYTDHKGLEWITTQKKLSLRQARWLEVLSDFDFEIIHIPGVTNTVLDALSRLYSDEPRGTV
jgi:RNase H-like domain found in reverse transcriptase/Reverse transcriptase (RNA-dependent DNA polymerase)/Retroviral aspartyl protease